MYPMLRIANEQMPSKWLDVRHLNLLQSVKLHLFAGRSCCYGNFSKRSLIMICRMSRVNDSSELLLSETWQWNTENIFYVQFEYVLWNFLEFNYICAYGSRQSTLLWVLHYWPTPNPPLSITSSLSSIRYSLQWKTKITQLSFVHNFRVKIC